ncbi:hypothetical protein CMUS01_10001 [Colletotrichum musicola]|uniref:Uncharacterized protein n=1 Tax=Colletotrichum musicola TaxID=2175873 RepID=A0A8H6N979_9PEZI|nr:hypothetical protein CMUS01_10001 [Colletotrichum musicola]
MNFTVPLNLTYANWTAPPLNELNFPTNCTATAEFAHTWLSSESVGVDNVAASAYFRQALPPSLRGLPSDGQLIDWYLELLQIHDEYHKENPYNGSNPSPLITKVTAGAFRACTVEVCQALEWDGVPDILGPGVMISAYIQAVLATILGLVPLWKWVFRRRGITPGRWQQLVIDSFNATLGVFVNACLFLCLSVSLAAIILISRRDFDGGSTLVTLIWAISLFYLSALNFPALLDEMVHKDTQRKAGKCRKMVRAWLAFTSFVLLWYMIIFITLIRQLLLDRSGSNSGDSKWTLGQFFALGAWLPVLMELWSLLREGVEKGLDGRVPDGWTVVRTDRLAVTLTGGDDDGVELLAESRKPLRGQTWSIAATGHANDVEQSVPRSTTC